MLTNYSPFFAKRLQNGRNLACNSVKWVERLAISCPCFKIVASRWAWLGAKELVGGEERTDVATKVGRSWRVLGGALLGTACEGSCGGS